MPGYAIHFVEILRLMFTRVAHDVACMCMM